MGETAPEPKWWREFMRPVPVVSLALAILGLVLGWYAYYKTAERPLIAWTRERQIVFDYNNASPAITVLDADSAKVSSNVYASQFIVWNAGNTRFDDVDDSTTVRQPLTFALHGDGRILSASITKRANDTAGSWTMDTLAKSATMKWRHFDQGAAAQVLVLFAGSKDTEIEPTIAIAGSSVLCSCGRPQSTISLLISCAISLVLGMVTSLIAMRGIAPLGLVPLIKTRGGALATAGAVAIIAIGVTAFWLSSLIITVPVFPS